MCLLVAAEMLKEIESDISVSRPERVHKVLSNVQADHRNAFFVLDEPFGVAPFAVDCCDLQRVERTADHGVSDIIEFLDWIDLIEFAVSLEEIASAFSPVFIMKTPA